MIEILVYALILKISTSKWMNWIWSGVLTAVIPYAIGLMLHMIILSGYKTPLHQAVTVDGLTMLAVQIVLGLSVFYWLDKLEDSLSTWCIVAIVGYVAIYLIVPYIIVSFV